MIRITSLCDNVNDSKKMWSVEGSAILVEVDDRKFMFDVGRYAEILKHNLGVLGLSEADIDGVILTHGHVGHIGAMRGDIHFPNATIYYGAGLDTPKFKWSTEKTKAVGNEKLLDNIRQQYPCVMVDDVYALIPGKVFLFKSKMYSNGLSPKDLIRMKVSVNGELKTDDFGDELNLCIRHAEGLTVLTGCAHRGVGNIIRTASELFPGERIYAMMGGTHIFDDPKRIGEYVDLMKEYGVRVAAPSHCTGILGRAHVAEELKEAYIPFGTGAELWIGED